MALDTTSSKTVAAHPGKSQASTRSISVLIVSVYLSYFTQSWRSTHIPFCRPRHTQKHAYSPQKWRLKKIFVYLRPSFMLLIDLCPHALALQVVGTLLTQWAEPSVTSEPQCKSDFAGRCAWGVCSCLFFLSPVPRRGNPPTPAPAHIQGLALPVPRR